MDNGAAVKVRDLRKSYGDVAAVRGIDLEINRGEVFALLGPNGAGKTTTVARGRTNAEIGQALFISEATVKTHLLRAFGK
jgi:ABC-type multidrug transport system ATPase subunit